MWKPFQRVERGFSWYRTALLQSMTDQLDCRNLIQWFKWQSNKGYMLSCHWRITGIQHLMRLSLCRVTLFRTTMVSQRCAWCQMRPWTNRHFTGGMDLYVRQFGLQDHDDFYTNDMILTAFQNYTKEIVLRYLNSPAVFSWELANDAR